MTAERPGEHAVHNPARRAHTLYHRKKAGVVRMREDISQRAVELALYIIENDATVRDAAKRFGVSKSTVHTVVTF